MNTSDKQTETDDLEHNDQPHEEMYTCVDCGNEHEASKLYVLRLSELAKIKSVYIKPDDLPGHALCYDCVDPDLEIGKDLYTLASSLDRCRKDNSRPRPHNSNGHSRQSQQKPANRPVQSQAIVTNAELAETVLCVICLMMDKVTRMERRVALAPGWLGCRIMEAIRRFPKDLRNTDLVYLGSADLLKDGEKGFATCAECIGTSVNNLQEKAQELGFPEHEIITGIAVWQLVAMIKGVRRAEERKASRNY